jgi:hypothetical protein
MRHRFSYVSATFDWTWWKFMWHHGPIGLFRNRKSVTPGRWGFYFFGIEFGSRNPGDKVGVWLKEHWLWPW